MVDILRAIFKPLPKPGEVFTFEQEHRDPWGDATYDVEVIETKKGWVRYENIHGSIKSLKRAEFHLCYVKRED